MPTTCSNHSGLILVPPSPVSNKISVDLRLGLVNKTADTKNWRFDLFLDTPDATGLLSSEMVAVAAGGWHLMKKIIKTAGLEGMHRVIGYVTDMATGEVMTHYRPLEVLECADRSTDRIDGAFAGFYHWSEQEGRLWNEDIKHLTREDWCDMMRAMHEVGMDLLLPQEAFRNQEYVDRHKMDEDGYFGKAFYPSELFPGRMDMIACDDPLDACFTAANELDMNILLPVGMYAWFDFSAESLEWHKKVAKEMWDRYGHHKSVYGFYVSEEVCGDLGATDKNRDDIVKFFEEFTAYCRTLAPERPIMLASNCHFIHRADAWYPKFLANLDILCPFAFHRMPENDLTGEQAAADLQKICDDAGSHLWLDMEAFLFHEDQALYPRPVEGLVEDFRRFPNFEKVVCYQFPGIFNAPWARIKPGGPDTVKLFNDYKAYLEAHPAWRKR